MDERRKHIRFPIIKDLAEPIELTVINTNAHHNAHRVEKLPGILTNFSAGGMVLVLMGRIDEKQNLKLSMHLPGFDRFSVEGKVVWAKPKATTTIIGIQFTKIDQDHAKQITHMAEAFWECETRIKDKALTVCFHGCMYWDLCEKPAKLKTLKPVRV